MNCMAVFGAIFIVFWYTGSASKLFSGQRICRRGTERPCYRLAHIPDPRQRVNYEVARESCRNDGGELLSIETEDEQRLVERLTHELAGDFWIGLRRSLRHREPGTSCSALYYWLDRSQATYRNWQWDEPSCGREMCVVLHQRPSQVGGVSYKWNDISCNLRHNFICKYSDEKKFDIVITPPSPKYTEAPVISVTPDQHSVTGDDGDLRAGVSESSVSSDVTLNILLITIPIMLLLLLTAFGLYCYKLVANRRKAQSEPIYAKPGQWVSVGGSDSAGILFSQQGAAHAYSSPSFGIGAPQRHSCSPPGGQGEDYENVPTKAPASGFVTNDIYESCRNPSAVEAGWVDNEIYGY